MDDERMDEENFLALNTLPNWIWWLAGATFFVGIVAVALDAYGLI